MTPVLKGAPNTFTNKSSAHPATFTNPGINPYNKITIIANEMAIAKREPFAFVFLNFL